MREKQEEETETLGHLRRAVIFSWFPPAGWLFPIFASTPPRRGDNAPLRARSRARTTADGTVRIVTARPQS